MCNTLCISWAYICMFVKYSHTFGDRPLPYTCPFWPRKLSPMSGRQAGLKTERSALSSVSWLSIRFEKLKEFRILSSVALNCQLMSHGCPQTLSGHWTAKKRITRNVPTKMQQCDVICRVCEVFMDENLGDPNLPHS